MKQVHFTLQGKGGVGKSFVSSLITQYLRAKGEPVVAVDGPVNATLAGYKAFGTQRLELMEGGSLVERNFDALIERVVAEDSHFVIDNAARRASFRCLLHRRKRRYQRDCRARQTGCHPYRHHRRPSDPRHARRVRFTVEQMPEETRIVVWLNEFFGDIEAEGKTLRK